MNLIKHIASAGWPVTLPTATIRKIVSNGQPGTEIQVLPLRDGRVFIFAGKRTTLDGPLNGVPLHLSPEETRAVASEITRAAMAASETFPTPSGMNAREQLKAAEDMLSFTHESISMGLRSPEDAIRLWRAWQKHPEESMPDQWQHSELVAVLGYNPWTDPLPAEHQQQMEIE